MTDLAWRKSSRSGSSTNCVEVTWVGNAIAVRDSKNPDGDRMVVSEQRWSNFLNDLKAGRFDRDLR